jgi:hypothetical protein
MTDTPRILVPRVKIIEPRSALVLRTGVKGRFKLRAFTKYGRSRETPWIDNLILNALLDRIGVGGTTHIGCAVGTSNTAPSVEQTALVAQIATSSSIESSNLETFSDPPYGCAKTWVYRFNEGVAEGNLAELGVGLWTGSLLGSRELIRDEMGSPTVFPVASDEFLDVTYQLICYAPSVDFEDEIDIDIGGVPTAHAIVMRASNVTNSAEIGWRLVSGVGGEVASSFSGGGSSSLAGNHVAYNGAIGAVTESPAGGSANMGGTVNSAYSNGTYRRDYSLLAGLGEGNVTISAIRTRMCTTAPAGMSFQVSFDPPIAKDGTKVLALPFRHAWMRA